MLRIHVRGPTTDTSFCHVSGPYEFGRGPRREVPRCIIKDPSVSRDQLQVLELDGGCVRVQNLSSTTPVVLSDSTTLDTGESREMRPPLRLAVGASTIEIDVATGHDDDAMNTVLVPWRKPGQRGPTLRELGESPSAQAITQWLEMALDIQQSAKDLPELYERTAQALVDLVDLDFAMVLLHEEDDWEVVGQAAKNSHVSIDLSRTMLRRVIEEGRTLFQGAAELPLTESLRRTTAAVVSPILGLEREVVGALYGARTGRIGPAVQGLTELEAQVVQLFATATSTRRARAEASRIRVQFEQFFSPELARELQKNPGLLEGRMQEVTILVSDLRGFSRLSERLGPENTCRVMRDIIDQFTSRIIEHGGVVVDYAGDGILALWNAPVLQEDHAVRACRAGLAMRDDLPELNEKWKGLAEGQLAAGIGVNTGIALVGNTGSHHRLKFGPHGHTVNLASRVQDATKKLGLPLLITGSTRDKLPAEFATRRLCTAHVAGIREAVALYELRGLHAPSDWLHQRDVYETALADFEAGQWCNACQALVTLTGLDQAENRFDIPTVKLLRKAWESLEKREALDPVIDLTLA